MRGNQERHAVSAIPSTVVTPSADVRSLARLSPSSGWHLFRVWISIRRSGSNC